ncbi:GNAT family N-acetyltransferase [filamentous cyanobacterium CCP5]|nr:GNAT family N-acetyltransferase [filamentous cyanobacterium CCP5]
MARHRYSPLRKLLPVIASRDAIQANLQIRPEQAQDYGAIATVHTRAFGQPDEAKLVEQIRHSNEYLSGLSLVAEVDAQVVGHILLSYGKIVGSETWLVLVLAPLGVLPDYQCQGIGRQLVNQGLQTARSLGNTLVTVLGNPSYYGRLGFEPAADYGLIHPFPVPAEAFQVNWLNRSSEIRGQLQYGSAFDSLVG